MALQNIAVLIDADNASAKNIGTVFSEIEKLGKISCKKIYGDWGQDNLKSWQAVILQYAIDPMQQFAYVKGKNATDIALVIEAMDLLHSGKYDGFCLVSSDSDFASLAVRIRKSGLPVYGFGKETAVISFRQACDKFFEVEKLGQALPETSKTIKPIATPQLKMDTKLINALRDVVAKTLDKNDEDWSNYGEVVKIFKRKYPNLSQENYGYEKLIHLIKATELFEIKDKKQDGVVRIFVKSKKSKTESPTPTKYTTQQLKQETQLIQAIYQLIDSNPKAENGWSNMSYIASQLNQNPAIDTKKYGYAKFSDLMTAIRIFDIQKQANGYYIKRKQTKAPQPQAVQKTATTATLESATNQPLILTQTIQILVETGEAIDTVLWRLTPQKKVRNDSDMIFYGQTHSEDNNISLSVEPTANQTLLSEFDCNLATQPSDIQRLSFTLSHEHSDLPMNQPIHVSINQNNQQLFNGKFVVNEQTAQSMMLFELVKVATGWQFVQRQQLIKGDLRKICDVLGIEVSDD